MTESGKIIELRGDGKAVVRFVRTDACAYCKLCSMRGGDEHIDMAMDNKLSAKIDDAVIVQMKDGGMGLIAILLYGIPLLLMAAAILITILLKAQDYIIGTVAVAVCVAAYGVIYLINKKVKPKRRLAPEMVKIIKK